MHIELTSNPDPVDVDRIQQGVQRYESSMVSQGSELEHQFDFAILARDDRGELLGGLRAHAFWNAMHIELLWVSERHRGNRIGSQLLQRAESHALQNEFNIAYLDTSQARVFYENHGYTVFGVLEDQPVGHDLYFMKKRLS